MVECFGKVLVGGNERITGRLWRVGDASRERTDSARILIWDGISDVSGALGDSVVGIVISEENSAAALPVGVPIFVISDVSAIPSDRIAVLDCERQRLCVDPDVDVIKCCIGCLLPRPQAGLSWICTDSQMVTDGCDGVAVTLSGGEERAYELLCDVADRNPGARIVAETEFDGGVMERIRGVMRAAVWGRVSLLCRTGTPERAEEFLGMTHTAFCALEGEGREFNGFIPKGVLVDTPLLLLSPPSRLADFFVIDAPALIYRFTGSREITPSAHGVLSYVGQFSDKLEDGQGALKICERTVKCCLEFLEKNGGIREIYTDRATARALNKWL